MTSASRSSARRNGASRSRSKAAARGRARPRPGGKPRPRAEPGDDGADVVAARSNPLGLEVDDEVLEFIAALERFKKQHGRPFPSWSEVLHVVRSLGYRRTGTD
jgi:hypothetical protein